MKLTSIPLLAVFFVACQQPAQKETSEQARINNFLTALVNRQQLPGLTVSATRNDTVVYTAAFGYRNIETKDPMKATYDFHWASVSKTFVATAILQLVEKGQIKLDEKLINYVPYFKLKDENYKIITIRQMLNHTSGIGDVDDYEWDKPQYDEGAPERFVRSLANDKMLFAPGTSWSYSNTAFEILGVVITRVSGMPFETYVQNNIFEPLGMVHSSFIYPEIPDSLRVSGHLWAGKPIVSKVYPYNRMHAPSSTLNSNVVEMTHYAMANLHRGVYNKTRILSDSTYNLIWNNSVRQENKPSIGASWWLDEHRGLKTVSHSGGDTGFRSFLLLVPEKQISVMVACNYELCRTGEVAFAVLDLMLGETPEEVKRQIGFSFAEVLIDKGLEKAKAYYKETNEDSIQRKYYLWKEDEAAIAYPGYLLLDQKMFPEALQIFTFNVELYPKSGYAYYHRGIAYVRMDSIDLARSNFKKAIELIPTEEDFMTELSKLDKR